MEVYPLSQPGLGIIPRVDHRIDELFLQGRLMKNDVERTRINESQMGESMNVSWQTLTEFSLSSEPGNEKIAMARVASLLEPLNIADTLLERIKTAVAEATMNALEHGNRYQPDIPVNIRVETASNKLRIQVEDQGRGPKRLTPETPDLEAKLAGLQSPRGWGLFLIEKMVDELIVTTGKDYHRLELIFDLIDPESSE